MLKVKNITLIANIIDTPLVAEQIHPQHLPLFLIFCIFLLKKFHPVRLEKTAKSFFRRYEKYPAIL